jgi:small subunit ribosomal protein S21
MFEVTVRDNKIEHALRRLKKKVKDSGLLIELREREFFIKPSLKKREQRKRARAMYKNLSKNK